MLVSGIFVWCSLFESLALIMIRVVMSSFSLVPRLSKGGGGKESLVHTVCACVKLCTRLTRAMTCYDVLVTFDCVLTSALIDFF